MTRASGGSGSPSYQQLDVGDVLPRHRRDGTGGVHADVQRLALGVAGDEGGVDRHLGLAAVGT